jgi:hypothetical protein
VSIQKQCADCLRDSYAVLTGKKLLSGHAHELAAAFFGYGTAAALQSEVIYPLSELIAADILIPDIARMDARRGQLVGLPADLPDSRELARTLSEMLKSGGHFAGQVWDSEYLSDDINGYVQQDPMLIEDALSGQMAETNAYFDELYLDEVDIEVTHEVMVATITGSLNGEQDQDRAFHGDKIAFTSVMTMNRVAGRSAYSKPDFDTSGEVDDAMYYDPEP